jgi:hypothetical protein
MTALHAAKGIARRITPILHESALESSVTARSPCLGPTGRHMTVKPMRLVHYAMD